MEENEKPQQPQVIELRISQVMGSNTVNVTGPVDNKMLCYSLLEMARDAIKDHADRKLAEAELNAALVSTPNNKKSTRFRLFK
jgi:hypothetical protein